MVKLRSLFSTFLHSMEDESDGPEQFDFDYTLIPPLALASAVPQSQKPSREWVRLVARRVAAFVLNTVVTSERGFSGTGHYLDSLREALGELSDDARREAGKALASALADEGIPRDHEGLHRLFESFLQELASEVLFDVIKILLDLGGIEGEAESIEDFRKLFQTIELPAIAETYDTDETFAYLRVAGPNPMLLTRLESCPAKFPVAEAQFQAVLGGGDQLARAGEEGRLYGVDFAAFEGALSGTFPDYQKYLFAPQALLAVPEGGDGRLRPVACSRRTSKGRCSTMTRPSPS